ncbi:replication protein A 32 kDa subunit-B [Sitophilus oryzae]|uniref:Replication protein A 32 kDa subunit-B n=1 Tax=Sitophilus oryzae TaxID=7048 RepID=A0A6J2YKV2_SITOR|nr:replication protein A 32 kDa subunit-B [Sitophilus oryzae]
MNTWNPGMRDTTGAGGFLHNTINVNSPATKPKRGRRIQSLLPLVIRQIRDCNHDEFKLFGRQAQIVILVGIIKEVEVQSTKATYKIEDYTGSIKMVWWLENDSRDGSPKLPSVKEGSYVKVFGTIRSQNNDKSIMVLKMFPVENCNIINTHLLEVVHTRLQAESKQLNTTKKILKNNPGAQLINSMKCYDENVAGAAEVKFTDMQNKVYKILKANTTDTGTNRVSVLSKFSANEKRAANEALEFLVNEGHAYSTIDSEHFKSTDGDAN